MRVPRAVTPGSHGHLTTFFESSGLQQPSPSVPLTWQCQLESVTTFLEFGYFADCTLLNRFFFYSSSFFFFLHSLALVILFLIVVSSFLAPAPAAVFVLIIIP